MSAVELGGGYAPVYRSSALVDNGDAFVSYKMVGLDLDLLLKFQREQRKYGSLGVEPHQLASVRDQKRLLVQGSGWRQEN